MASASPGGPGSIAGCLATSSVTASISGLRSAYVGVVKMKPDRTATRQCPRSSRRPAYRKSGLRAAIEATAQVYRFWPRLKSQWQLAAGRDLVRYCLGTERFGARLVGLIDESVRLADAGHPAFQRLLVVRRQVLAEEGALVARQQVRIRLSHKPEVVLLHQRGEPQRR